MYELKQGVRAIDLAVLSGRERQSPRTGYVHLFPPDPEALDTIPLYENFCFALALFRQKSTESVLEGKELIARLLAFQTEEGNFPTFLHDYPRAWDPCAALKIAPVLIYLLKFFESVLGSELKQKIAAALDRALRFSRERKMPSWLWEARLAAVSSQEVPELPRETHSFNAEEWFHWIVSRQIVEEESSLPIPFDKNLQVFTGPVSPQEKGEPGPVAIEYILSEPNGFSKRLLHLHPQQLHAALLAPFSSSIATEKLFIWQPFCEKGGVRLLWKGIDIIHSLVIPEGKVELAESDLCRVEIDLPDDIEWGRGDLCEVALFCDLSAETQVRVEGQRASVFRFGERVSIATAGLQIEVVFQQVAGNGDFCGHISRGNRPGQIACRGKGFYDAYDWRIALRTLRREGAGKVEVCLAVYTE